MIPEKQLWTLVLAQAAFDLHGVRRSGSANQKVFARDARRWFESSQTSPGSFRWVAAVLDLDAATVRRKVFGLKQASLKAQIRAEKIHRGAHVQRRKRVA